MKLTRNISALSLAQIAGYIIPLLEIPILARALGPIQYSQIVLLQSIALLASLLVEYGFNLSASRRVASSDKCSQTQTKIFSDVLSAKIVLCMLLVILLVVAATISCQQLFKIEKSLLPWAFLYFLAFAFSPFWMYQGLEKMMGIVIFELALRFFGLGMLILVIKTPSDAILALAILACVSATNTAVTNAWLLKDLGRLTLSMSAGIREIKNGFHIFLYRSSNSIILGSAPSVIALAGGPVAVAAYVPAEKIIRALVGLANPMLTALYPHLSTQLGNRNLTGLKFAWKTVISSLIAGIICAVVLGQLAVPLVAIAFGNDFIMVSALLIIFAWIIPLRIGSQALGLLILLPLHRDRITSFLYVTHSVLALGIGGVLTSFQGPVGMVYGFLLAESSLFLCLGTASILATRDARLPGSMK